MGNPTYTPLQEILHDGGFIVSESNGHRSRDSGTLAAGAKVLAGTLLGLILAGTTASAAALGTNTGNGTVGTITPVSTPAQVGAYALAYTSATAFTVTAPDGATANGTNGVAFSALGIGFTMTTGGTAMVAGDGFTITVTGAVGKPTAASVANAGNTGNSTSSAVTTTGYAPTVGNYIVTFLKANTNLGTFQVEDPSGKVIGHGIVGTAFSGGGLTFTIADGATDFVEGDQFVITVAAGSGKYRAWDPANVDGSQTVAGILFATKDATSVDKACLVFARHGEVNQSELIFPTGSNAAVIAAGVAGLKALGIIAR
jgi:hypothetical protein